MLAQKEHHKYSSSVDVYMLYMFIFNQWADFN